MAGTQQQRILVLHLLAHLPWMKQPRVTLVNLGIKTRPSDIVIRSYRLGVPAQNVTKT